MASNQSKVAETKPRATEKKSEKNPGHLPICPTPPKAVDNVPALLIDSEGGGIPKPDTGQNSKKDDEHSMSGSGPKLHTNETTSQVQVKGVVLTQDKGVSSGEPHPAATILSDIVESVAGDKKGELTPKPPDTTQISTQDGQRVIQDTFQETDTKPVETNTAVVPPSTSPEDDSVKAPQEIYTKSDKTETKPDTTNSSEMETQGVASKSSETEKREITATTSDMETQEVASKPTDVTPQQPAEDTHKILPNQDSVPKPVPMETQEPVLNEKLKDDKEPVLKPIESKQETDQKEVEIAQETQIPVEMTEIDKKPFEIVIEIAEKDVEKAQETPPVENRQEPEQITVETTEELVLKDETPQGSSQIPEEKSSEQPEIKPPEKLSQESDTNPVESKPEKYAEVAPQALIAPVQNPPESKDFSPMSEEESVVAKTVQEGPGIELTTQTSTISTEPVSIITDAGTGSKEPATTTPQIITPSTDNVTPPESLMPEKEVVMTSSSIPESKPDVSDTNDVIILDDVNDKTELITQPKDVILTSEVIVPPTQFHQPNIAVPPVAVTKEELSPELMQVDPAPLPPTDTELMDVGQVLTAPSTEQPIAPPTVPPSAPIDTIVISDSPASTVSYSTQSMEQMDVIVLSSPEQCSPISTPCSTTPPSKRSKVSLSDIVSPSSPPKPTGSKSQLSADLELLEQLINSCDKLVGLSIQDQNVCFSYQHKGVCNEYTLICIEGDYPQVTLLVTSNEGNHSDILSKRLPCIAWDLLLQCCSRQGVSPPATDSLTPELLELLHPVFQSQISSQSNASQATNCTDDDELGSTDDSSNEDDPYDYGNELDDEPAMHQLLLDDVDRVKQKFNPNAIVTRNYGGIGDIDIDLIIDMNFLEPEIARAWGVKHTVPLTVRLSLSADHYLDGGDIKTEVFQEDRSNTKGICKQMDKIISNFISSSVRAEKNPLCNSKVQEAVESHRDMEQRLAELRRARSKVGGGTGEKKGMISQFVGRFSREKQVDSDLLVAQLVEMGWEADLAVHALQQCSMDLEKALDYLSNERIEEFDEDMNPKTFTKQQSRGAEVSGLDWMSDLSDTNQGAIKSKIAPPLSHGFLCHVIQYILNRIPTLNDFCVICDETHLFSNGAMLKPTVCARELCSFAFQTLGVMADVADSIATGPEVVELLVAMCNAASLSTRREDILDPYPTVVDPSNPKQFALHPKDKDFKKVEKAMSFVVQELKSLPAVLKERLDSLNPFSFPLLQWVLASNRCHIVKLPPDRQIKSMGTAHQFLLLSAPPAKEAAFRKLKLKHKSTYAFHGSRLENWHSIMRNGLLNASGTKFQLNGAAYGSGIYLSPHASVSFGYSGIHGGGPAPATAQKKGRPTMLSTQNLNCIALCEVIDVKIKKSGNIWVLPEADHVVTRFFFVYEDNTTGDTNFDTRQDKYIKEIENSVKSLL